MKNPLNAFAAKAVEMGAAEAKIIKTGTIVTAAWVRMKCRYGCSGYGSSLCCPPNTPDPEQMRKVIDGYAEGLLIHFSGKIPGKVNPSKIAVGLEREIFLSGYYKAFALSSGPCMLCRECNLKTCIHTEKARPSMEACGIDVYSTARGNGYPIEVVTDPSCLVNRYSLVLIE